MSAIGGFEPKNRSLSFINVLQNRIQRKHDMRIVIREIAIKVQYYENFGKVGKNLRKLPEQRFVLAGPKRVAMIHSTAHVSPIVGVAGNFVRPEPFISHSNANGAEQRIICCADGTSQKIMIVIIIRQQTSRHYQLERVN